MIFNKYYDRSLWLLLTTNNNDILSFIKSIPDSLCIDIQKKLEIYQLYLFNKGEKIDFLDENYSINGSVKTSGDMLYWYSIDFVTGALSLGEGVVDGENMYNTVKLKLYPFKEEIYANVENFDKCYLGEFSFDFIEDYVGGILYSLIYDRIEFNLIKLPFHKWVVHSRKNFSNIENDSECFYDIKNSYNFVNPRAIPYNFDKTALEQKYTLSRKKI